MVHCFLVVLSRLHYITNDRSIGSNRVYISFQLLSLTVTTNWRHNIVNLIFHSHFFFLAKFGTKRNNVTFMISQSFLHHPAVILVCVYMNLYNWRYWVPALNQQSSNFICHCDQCGPWSHCTSVSSNQSLFHQLSFWFSSKLKDG